MEPRGSLARSQRCTRTPTPRRPDPRRPRAGRRARRRAGARFGGESAVRRRGEAAMSSKQGERGSTAAALSTWVSLVHAAAHLGMGATALRKALERRAARRGREHGGSAGRRPGAEVRAPVAGAVLRGLGAAVTIRKVTRAGDAARHRHPLPEAGGHPEPLPEGRACPELGRGSRRGALAAPGRRAHRGSTRGTRGGPAMRRHCSGAARPDAGARACARPSAAHIGLPSVPSTLTAITAITAITTLTPGSGDGAAAVSFVGNHTAESRAVIAVIAVIVFVAGAALQL